MFGSRLDRHRGLCRKEKFSHFQQYTCLGATVLFSLAKSLDRGKKRIVGDDRLLLFVVGHFAWSELSIVNLSQNHLFWINLSYIEAMFGWPIYMIKHQTKFMSTLWSQTTTINILDLSGDHSRQRPVVEFNLQNPTVPPPPSLSSLVCVSTPSPSPSSPLSFPLPAPSPVPRSLFRLSSG